MKLPGQAGLLLRISHSSDIARRYFVVNGFDGALTMLGLIIGFLVSDHHDLEVVLNVCLGAAIALGMSGLSSAFVSENAERKRTLASLEQAMITDLKDSAHGDAAREIPLFIALVNGLAPLTISLTILLPLFLDMAGLPLPAAPLTLSVLIALLVVFLLGAYLGRISGVSWLRSGFQTLLVATLTVGLIYLLS